jgi:peptidyl-tRNA hydrolase
VSSTVHIDSECIVRDSSLFMVAIRRDISMERTNIISNVAFVGIDVLFFCSHVQRLGHVVAVW